MKQVVLLLAALAAAPAFAQNVYVTGSVGQASQRISFDGESANENKVGASVAVGYRFTPTFSIEGGYATFGKVSDSDSSSQASIKSDAIYAAVVGTFPVSPKVSLIGKLGVARGKSEMYVASGTFSANIDQNKTGAMFGFGAAYAVTPSLAVVTEFQHFGKTLDLDGVAVKASLVSVGARFSF
ncbi:MAG TPA: outer membrane beta-barrel protein [Telluria sp.]|nr:outer membrane beta-barrel protein [Telluria sp.]